MVRFTFWKVPTGGGVEGGRGVDGGGRTLGACTHSSWRWAELGGEERWRHLHGTTRSEVLGFGFIQLPVQVRLSVLHQWKLWANLE